MNITCITDLHGYKPNLEGGDILILAGDYTARDTLKEWADFFCWLKTQDYKHKILIAGNHDNYLYTAFPKTEEQAKSFSKSQDICEEYGFEYLCDSGTEIEGLKIWGSPWTTTFEGINPYCTAFTVGTDLQLADRFCNIPVDTNILITHNPPFGIFDKVNTGEHVGSKYLRDMVVSNYFSDLKMHVFGHIHECGGKLLNTCICNFVNASLVNGDYKFVNSPINIVI